MSERYHCQVTTKGVTVNRGRETYALREGSPNFEQVRALLLEGLSKDAVDWAAVMRLINPGEQLEAWSLGLFSYTKGQLFYGDELVPADLTEKFVAGMRSGGDSSHLLRFFARLKKNPDERVISQLFKFLSHTGIPIAKDGCVLAYKYVNKDGWDSYSGNTVHYALGQVASMPRDECDSNPTRTCSRGLHVGTSSYVGSYSRDRKVFVVKFDPADVVAVPKDYSGQKLRCCKLKPVGLSLATLPDSIYEEDDILDEGVEELKDEFIEAYSPPMKEAKLAALTLANLRKYARSIGVKRPGHIKGGKSVLLKVVQEKLGKTPKPAVPSVEELMQMKLEDMRKYALTKWGIVGASKIRGGKKELAKRIHDLASSL